MILHDRIEVVQRVLVGYDDYGNDLYEDVATTWPAEVQPLSSSEIVDAGSQVHSRYRAILPAKALDILTSGSAVTWRGKSYEVEGDIEPHTIRGRVHHVEFIAHRVTG